MFSPSSSEEEEEDELLVESLAFPSVLTAAAVGPGDDVGNAAVSSSESEESLPLLLLDEP